MNQRICDRCKRAISLPEMGLIRTKEIRTEAVFVFNTEKAYSIEYDLCPYCKALFLDFMEGEAIPACEKVPGS